MQGACPHTRLWPMQCRLRQLSAYLSVRASHPVGLQDNRRLYSVSLTFVTGGSTHITTNRRQGVQLC